jgi:hypothetical protein
MPPFSYPSDALPVGVGEAMRDKITKRTVEAIEPLPRDRFLWDTEIPRFGCKVTAKGAYLRPPIQPT